MRDTSLTQFSVTGEDLDIKGRQLVSFTLGGQKFDHVFLVCPLPTEAAGLIGTDFLERTGAEINFECGRMALSATGETHVANSNRQGKYAALTVFSEIQVGRSPQPTNREERHPLEKPFEASRYELTTDCNGSWLVRATENITIVPRCRQVATRMLGSQKGEPSLY